MQNDPMALIALVAGVAVLLAIVIAVYRRNQRQRTAALRENFGPEYDRTVAQQGGQARAERELLARQKRREELDIKLLSAEQHQRFSAAWGEVQQRFVDDPKGAVVEADGLVKDVMRTRGYPMGNFEQRVADLSVEHANVIEHYRAARALAQASENGQADTEDLRLAMVHFRELFSDLLRTQPPPELPVSHAPVQTQRLRNA